MKRKHLFIVALILTSGFISAQTNFVLHNFMGVPQNYLTNPAIENPSRLVIGFPGLSSVYVGISSTINFTSDYLAEDPLTGDRTFQFDELVRSLDDDNGFNLNLQQDIMYAGFSIPKGFISFGIGANIDAGINLDKELLELVEFGNDDDRFMNNTVDLSDMDFNMSAYLQYHLGLSLQLTDKLTVGGRLKYLIGLASINFEKFDATITTQSDLETDFSVQAEADILINAAFYGAPTLLGTIDMDNFDPLEYLFDSKNNGVAVDLGVQYLLNERVKFNASLIDFGFIEWKTDVVNFTVPNASFSFDGVDLGNVGAEGEDPSFEEILDTLEVRFGFVESNKNYRTTLATKYYLGGSYKLDAKSFVDILFWGQSIGGELHSAISLGISRQFGNAFGVKANYAIIQNSYANLGLGLSLKLGGVQFYLLSDNVLLAFDPYGNNHSRTGIRFGLNFNLAKRSPQTDLDLTMN